MRTDYAALDARARGLAGHLCTREELERWAALPDTAALGRLLQLSGRLAGLLPSHAGAADIEQAARRTGADHLARLVRWAGPANPVIDVYEAEQDRRSLRALLRGATEGAAPELRLAGLLPTARLPAALLAELAQARSPREIALRLLVLGDPHAAKLMALTRPARIDLLEVELALAQGLAERWRAAAARGDAALRHALRQRIDLLNAQAALQLAGTAADGAAASAFVSGGAVLSRQVFLDAAMAPTRAEAAARLAQAAAGSPLAGLLTPLADDPVRLETAALQHLLEDLRRRGRVDPLGSAPVQLFLARLAAQGIDLRRLAWGLALGVPAARLREGLVTPWT